MLADDAMNAEDVARCLGIGKNSVYQLAKSGQLASYRIGRKLRFTMRDVNAYLEASHRGGLAPAASVKPSNEGSTVREGTSAKDALPALRTAYAGTDAQARAAAFPGRGQSVIEAARFGNSSQAPFRIAGDEAAADLLANFLVGQGIPVARTYEGSYAALVNLYGGRADAALCCLYDLRSNSYNVPYVRRLAPGTSVIVLRLYRRNRGFIVERRNPRGFKTWGALLKDKVRLANCLRGTASRVLLDEKLRALEARTDLIAGYDDELETAVEAASRVAMGAADVAVGTRRDAFMVGTVGFVPLQTEWIDLVIVKNEHTRPFIRSVKKLLADNAFRSELESIEQGDLAGIGGIAYEC